jgi:hypothetical protein
LAGLALFTACAAPPAAAPGPAYQGPLFDPAQAPADFLDRQKVVATYGEERRSFDAVLQKHGEELTLLGLTPFGTRAFVVTQNGAEVSFQTFVGETFPFPPRYVLIDVQRVFYAPAGLAGAALPEGNRHAAISGELVTEAWHEGRLVQRTFVRADSTPPGAITVEYEGGMGPDGTPPRHVVFTNGWYGYRLDITTLSHERLESAAPGPEAPAPETPNPEAPSPEAPSPEAPSPETPSPRSF